MVEVTGTGIEVRLEDGRDVLVFIEFTDASGTLVNLLRMVGVVAEEDHPVRFDLEIKTTVNTSIGFHTVFQFTCCTTIELCHGHGSNTIFYIDGNGLS